MSWNFDNNNNGGTSQKAEFTKFPVGITKIRVLDDEPSVRWTHWDMRNKRSINCPGKGCPICEIRKNQKANGETQTWGMSRRFAINIFNLETNKVEIMEQGIGFFEDLRDLMEELTSERKKLKDAILKVKRRGQGKDDTSYRIDIDSIDPISGVDLEELTSKAIKLTEYFKAHTNEQILMLLNGSTWEEAMKKDEIATNNPHFETDEDVELS